MIDFRQTTRGFGRGEFYDLDGVECSVQHSSASSSACIWLGPDKTKARMHLTAEKLMFLMASVGVYQAGQGPTFITFQDYYDAPCVVRRGAGDSIEFGVVVRDGVMRLSPAMIDELWKPLGRWLDTESLYDPA